MYSSFLFLVLTSRITRKSFNTTVFIHLFRIIYLWVPLGLHEKLFYLNGLQFDFQCGNIIDTHISFLFRCSFFGPFAFCWSCCLCIDRIVGSYGCENPYLWCNMWWISIFPWMFWMSHKWIFLHCWLRPVELTVPKKEKRLNQCSVCPLCKRKTAKKVENKVKEPKNLEHLIRYECG